MGEVIDIETKIHDRDVVIRGRAKSVPIHPMLEAEIAIRDPLMERGAGEIVAFYQDSILNGLSAAHALREAIVRARRIS